ncbi:signal transduction histidine kinase [Nonlabens ulvanivorans]|uniref:Signal transduction histidine kinase n=1 Tax=Nonlabens ulvanivorans TaxID=906888 RepID=A0A090QB92_NONUL|nr:hypothetical protein [Nonlabens ulvanivorans]GAK99018.1 signal transduction histidine kinase [Nonlabens ulvanivorans]
MAMHELQRDYSTKDLQFISIDKQGTILTTDQQLFELKKDSSIKSFHPFFEGIDTYFLEKSDHIKLECVHLNDRVFDIDFIKMMMIPLSSFLEKELISIIEYN